MPWQFQSRIRMLFMTGKGTGRIIMIMGLRTYFMSTWLVVILISNSCIFSVVGFHEFELRLLIAQSLFLLEPG